MISGNGIQNGTESLTLPEPMADSTEDGPFLVVLGTAQDGGYPQAGCEKPCCATAWNYPSQRRFVSCLAIVDPGSSERWIIDATPDIRNQIGRLNQIQPFLESPVLSGIFLTHAHIGHYTGLIQLGPESMGAKEIPVYAMPRMIDFLKGNEPWNQLIRGKNIEIRPLQDGRTVGLTGQISVTPFLVPHRDEFSETVGYRIDGPNASALYIPDIDRWSVPICDMVATVSIAYLDGTFFNKGEAVDREESEIPHPNILESISLFENQPDTLRSRIRFLHLNHTNPALLPGSDPRDRVENAGMKIAEEGERVSL